eukprot:GGOE01022007.1.p1 GENE.GGOE01022007.1~~GGOE01022007.1.p1  ORF type:complete len:438 (+),score=112.08 GGOE01022007.1:1144-2457(+)
MARGQRAAPYPGLANDNVCGVAYQSVQLDEEDPNSCDLTPLSRGLRRRVVTSLKEHETVWHFEKTFHVVAFAGYLLMGLLPLVLWGYLLVVHISEDERVMNQLWLLITGCCLAVLCALMAFNSSRMCNTCHVFTSSRILWVAENGPLRWIRYDDAELPNDVEGNVAKVRVAGAIPDVQGGPLHELCYHHVNGVDGLERLVYQEVTRHRLLQSGACLPSEPPVAPASLPPPVVARIQALLQPGEHLLWCQRPLPFQVASFSIPLLLLLVSCIPWLFWVDVDDGLGYNLVLEAASITGIVCSILLAVWECFQCRVVYFLTSHALSVYYVHSGIALSFPLAQLKSVGVWPEGGQSGSLTFLFRCDSVSALCLQVQRRVGPLATRHVRPVAENVWFLRIKDGPRLLERVIGRRQVPMSGSQPTCQDAGPEPVCGVPIACTP